MEGRSDGARPVSPRFSGGQPCFHTLNSFLTSVSPQKNQVEETQLQAKGTPGITDLWSCPAATQPGAFPFTGLSGAKVGCRQRCFRDPKRVGVENLVTELRLPSWRRIKDSSAGSGTALTRLLSFPFLFIFPLINLNFFD